MKIGARIHKLLLWADNHSPRTKELRRYIDDLHSAIVADVNRSKELIRAAGQMQADRNAMAGIAFKLAVCVDGLEPDMTEEEFRLYASARINILVMPHMNKKLDDDTRALILGEGELAFEEVKRLGCTEALIDDMRTNFHRSLMLQPPEDQVLTDEQAVRTLEDVAVESTGG